MSSTKTNYDLDVTCPNLKADEALVLCGASNILGDWDEKKALHFQSLGNNKWRLGIDASTLQSSQPYRLAIYNKTQKAIKDWEPGFYRVLQPISSKDETVRSEIITYRQGTSWRVSGVAIPVFSLRSENSSGIGEFSDLKLLVDWAHNTKQTVIQVLPINDTTINHTKEDSYPYNVISIYALHPIYLGLHEYPLKNEELSKRYKEQARKLNSLPDVDYDNVVTLKTTYIKDLFNEVGKETLKEEAYETFYKQNEEWLFPYACFSYLRDLNKTSEMSKWRAHSKYNKKELQALVADDSRIQQDLDRIYFIQYLLHKQLLAVREYAHRKGVMLKGDIPIGISPNSVEVWTDPHLFNLETQTGVTPDLFSARGQNWGFPTYNWDEMAKDGYQWWVKRFRKMADYFDAYRIDHVLGFFRIWEIPGSSVHVGLGRFCPALPLSPEEIRATGIEFDEERMAKPYIHEDSLGEDFAEYAPEVVEKFLQKNASGRLDFKEEFNTEIKIKEHFKNTEDPKSVKIREGLYGLCAEVLFIRDRKQKDRFHPRYTPWQTQSYRNLSTEERAAFDLLHNDFFDNRHTEFWREEAMKKLPILVSCTKMLACGEDVGLIPSCVPSVMRELKILSLEIERIPKTHKTPFTDVKKIPYLSVCTTSSHDANPLRAWWLEDRKQTQKYYEEVLRKEGKAPEQCTPELCSQILANHLNSPAMLAIFPLQDWLALNKYLRRSDPQEERINIPTRQDQYWKYRMHLTLEELIKANDLNKDIVMLLKAAGRT